MPTQQFLQFDAHSKRLVCRDEWTIDHIASLQHAFKKLSFPSGSIIIDGNSIVQMDTAGAWFLLQQMGYLKKKGFNVELENFSEENQKLLSIIGKHTGQMKEIPKIHHLNWIERVGRDALVQSNEFFSYLAFIGKLTLESIRILAHKGTIRLNAVSEIIYTTGCQALPIIAVLSFMIGVVIAYQMGVQLRNYGANIFIVDLLGAAILREFGPLLTAIMIAGKTGSAFTAQLGTMKVRQEIDALNTMGVTPTELLLLPRMLGLFIAMPLLTIWSDLFGILGGMLMAENMFGIGWQDFLTRFQQQVPLRSLIIGLGKAPVFALIIASIGCFEGMQVKGSADSVGKQTTRSVVWSIFFIILADAIFSLIFNKLKL